METYIDYIDEVRGSQNKIHASIRLEACGMTAGLRMDAGRGVALKKILTKRCIGRIPPRASGVVKYFKLESTRLD